MIILNKDQIAELIDLPAAALAIEDAYRASNAGEITLPPVGHITFPDNADCHIKYGHRHGDPTFIIKVATGFPHAPGGAPSGNGLSLVMSAESGEALAVLHDEMLLTDVRTGIGGAIATRLLARPDAKRLLVVGTGVQAEQQVRAHQALLEQPLDVAVWGRSTIKAEFVADHVGAEVATDLGDACRTADIIVTITSAREPLISSEWVTRGTHITAVGADAPGKHELDPALIETARHLVADSTSQCLDHGEFSALAKARHGDVVELGQLLGSGFTRGDGDVSIADLTGTAAQDIAIAQCVLTAYNEATPT